MRVLGPDAVGAALDFPPLIEALRRRSAAATWSRRQRHHHRVAVPGRRDGSLLIMPAWQSGRHLGVKLLTVFPDNEADARSSMMGQYLLLDARSGEPLALLDGPALTARRTAAASALAASYLARAG